MHPDSWSHAFLARYRAKSLQASNRRNRRAQSASQRRPGVADGRPPLCPNKAALGELSRGRAAARRAAVAARLDHGFRWHGGPVAGNGRYHRAAFLFRGLVSDKHPILKLFVAKVHRAPRLLTGDDKGRVSGTDSKLLALDCPHVHANAEMRGVLAVELDRDFTDAELAAGLARCGVPPPSIAVGHRDAAGRLLHPHLIWVLADSVACTSKGRAGPRRLWAKALAGLYAALLPLGADPGGMSNAMKMKNPLSPQWDRVVLAELPYALTPGPDGFPALVPHLDLDTAHARLRAAKGQERPFTADHPDPEVVGQSNAAFRHMAGFARHHIARHRDHGAGSHAEFRAEVAAEALRILPPGRAGERAARVLADSVVGWTWANYRTGPATPCTPAEIQARQAEGARATAVAKRGDTLAAVAGAIRQLAVAGVRVTQVAVAVAAGRSERTVRGCWAAAQAIAAKPAISSPPIDKKGPSPRRAASPGVGAMPGVHGPRPPAGPLLGPAPAGPAGGPPGMAGAASQPASPSDRLLGRHHRLPAVVGQPQLEIGHVALAKVALHGAQQRGAFMPAAGKPLAREACERGSVQGVEEAGVNLGRASLVRHRLSPLAGGIAQAHGRVTTLGMTRPARPEPVDARTCWKAAVSRGRPIRSK